MNPNAWSCISGSTPANMPVTGTQAVGVINARCRDCAVPEGYEGTASVHVDVEDIAILNDDQNANGKLVLDVDWQTGYGDGSAIVDATRGSYFTVNGARTITLRARFETAVVGVPVAPFASKRVTASIQFMTSISPKSALYTTPTVALPGNAGFSPFQRIPKQAMAVIAKSSEPAEFTRLRMEFYTAQNTGALRFATLNPNANGTTIDHGVEFFRFSSTNAMTAFASFELWL